MLKTPLITLAITFLGGCSASHPIKEWQQRFTDYAMKEGGGDLNILRESAELRATNSLRPAQIRFDHNDMPAPGLPPFVDRLDARGVMIGQHAKSGNPMFFFLVGVVERPYNGGDATTKDVRLVACMTTGERHHWKTSDPNPGALHQYLASAHGDRNRPAPNLRQGTFPRDDDDFRLEVRDGFAQATDARSGATWRVPLR